MDRRIEELQKSEAFYRSLIENATEVISILAEDGTTLHVSPAIRQLGYTPEERVGGGGFDLVHPEDREAVRRAFHEVLGGERGDRPVTYRVRTKAGEWRWFESTTSDLRQDAAVAGMVVTARDVTARREAEARITLQAHLLDAVGQAVVATDARDRIVYMNRAAERLYRRTIQEARGSAITALIGAERPLYEQESSGWVREGGIWSGEFVVRRRDGTTFPAYGTESPILDEAGRLTGFVTVAVDITERKHAESKLRENEERMQQSRRLEAVGRLAGGVAHDFNNLLTGIRGFTQLALDGMASGEHARADLEEVQRSADRAASLTRQLLAFSRKQILQSRDIDLNGIVRETHRLLDRLIGEDIRLVTHLTADPGTVHADPGQIEQVIVNLVLNSRDAMPAGGSIVIETGNTTITGTEATRYAFEVRPGPFVLLSVKDTGAGMDADTLRRVFEPFFTTKEQGKGTGLGLSTVYGIVKQSGGYIWLDSERGHGTTVRVYLPSVDGRPATRASRESREPARGSETVLLVEDDDTVRALTRRVLMRQGYQVLEARNGVEALRIAEPPDRVIDLVVSDIVMPELGGRQLVDQLRRIRPDLPVLLMSGYTDDAVVRGGRAKTGELFLAKPFTNEMLARTVRAALDRTSN